MCSVGRFFRGGECSLFTLAQTILLSDAPQCPELSFRRHSALRELKINLTDRSRLESAAGWLSVTLSTVTSNLFTKLTISIVLVSSFIRATGEIYVREWNAVDNVLDQLSLCEGMTLVVKAKVWVEEDKFGEVIEKYFPLMWGSGRVVSEVPPPPVRDEAQGYL